MQGKMINGVIKQDDNQKQQPINQRTFNDDARIKAVSKKYAHKQAGQYHKCAQKRIDNIHQWIISNIERF